MTKKLFPFILSMMLLSACGTNKIVSSTGGSTNLAAAKVITKHYESAPKFNTLASRLKVRYEDKNTTQNVGVSLRIEKDKTIWMSATVLGYPVAKVLITPENVKYYEKISGTYFDGDFSLLSEVLGTELDFKKVQNLLLGQAIYDLREEAYVMETSERGYVLQPKRQLALFSRLFLLNATNYKATAQQLTSNTKQQSAIVTYSSYQDVNGQILPNAINIVANEDNEATKIDITYRSVDLNVDVRFPFNIPDGFDEIIIN